MVEKLRRLNEEGTSRFADFIASGASGPVPLYLLTDPATSVPILRDIVLVRRLVANRFEFGQMLVALLAPLEAASVSVDRGIWSALALYWFDQLCPATPTGRAPDRVYRYVLSSDYRHYYRHLVRSPWQLVRDHGDNARFLLLASNDGDEPLRRHGELLEQLGSVQAIIRSRSIIASAAALYGDRVTGRPVRGAAGSGAGSARRLARVLRQLDLTFDPELLPNGRLLEILPAEFDKFKRDIRTQRMGEATATKLTPASIG
jgi:hypothetical protein